ncbi:peptidase S41 family [Phascolarctobacterium succinatutens CAG:287]|uniref:Peptidase S41 family n=1 Tax=Phascolarctobacterium succinatutens CAG:287 TaxID=1263101 RepID=R6X448_9FIRM|nr:S41 family peptidase [Phascolarctobacterium succinatutens]CDD10996.1 peptidase S41 family [Phascolarctobacterium succinatutens CAG:287]
MFGKRRWQLTACCLLTAVLTTAAIVGTEAVLLNRLTGSVSESVRFLRTMKLLKRNYNGEVDNHQLFDGALKGMVESVGDPYTVYLNKKDFQQLSEMTVGSFGGIGIVFGKRGNDYVVISALEDNPGAKAGIKSGDIITAIDDKSTREMNMEQVANKIRGKYGTTVTLELKDKEGKLRKVNVVRAEIKNPSVAGQMLANTKIGYIRIAIFNENTGDDFAKKYAELEKQGMQALVLDLRENPGGILDAGVDVAKMLVPKGPIVSVIDKNGNKFEETSSLEKVKYPLAVLVDHGSASASEIVAGAIKDTKSGKLFGVKTFGKGSVQSVYRLDNNTAVKITVAKYYTPSGVSIHNVGIEPDVKVELPDDATVDVQLKAAEDYLLQQLQ